MNFGKKMRILLREKGEGIVSGVIWLGVVAIVSGTIAYGVWNGIASNGSSAKNDITNTMTTQTTNAKAITVP